MNFPQIPVESTAESEERADFSLIFPNQLPNTGGDK